VAKPTIWLALTNLLPDMQADTLIADKAFDADKRVIELLRSAAKAPSYRQKPTGKPPANSTGTFIWPDISSRISSLGSSNTEPSQPQGESHLEFP
jgi:hypothetical protein